LYSPPRLTPRKASLLTAGGDQGDKEDEVKYRG
jgi:hypothetical protein